MPVANGTALNIYKLPFYDELISFTNILKIVWPILVLAGYISNTFNMVVFLKAGVKDSVSTLLLTLSVSDFLYLILITPTVIYWRYTGTHTTRIVHFVTYWPATTMYDYSSYISVFLSVTRCACVVKPLHFKSVFTKNRTVIAVVLLFCIDVLLHIPVLSIHQLRWVTDPSTNRTYLDLNRNFDLENAKIKINDALNKNAIAWTLFVVMIVCTALLSFKLFESSKIRSLPASDPDSGEPSQTQKQKLSPKDARVVKSVVLVCTIFIVAQIPAFSYSMVRVFAKTFIAGGSYEWLLAIGINLSVSCYIVNASVNIFVYYNCNSKYRAVFRSLVGINDEEKNLRKVHKTKESKVW